MRVFALYMNGASTYTMFARRAHSKTRAQAGKKHSHLLWALAKRQLWAGRAWHGVADFAARIERFPSQWAAALSLKTTIDAALNGR